MGPILFVPFTPHPRIAMLNAKHYNTAMPRGPKGEKRPGDVIGTAIKVARIATGEEPEELDDDGKSKAAVELGRKGGQARAKSMSAERRKEIARKAAQKRWSSGSE